MVGRKGRTTARYEVTNQCEKIVTGYVNATTNLRTGYTLERLANQQYRVTWAAGTFPGASFPMVFTYQGAVPLSTWGAQSNGSGTFTTQTNVGDTIWFTITEIK